MWLGQTASVPNIPGMDVPKDIKDQGVHTDDPVNSKFFLKDLYRAVRITTIYTGILLGVYVGESWFNGI